jgi:hypothetical protein
MQLVTPNAWHSMSLRRKKKEKKKKVFPAGNMVEMLEFFPEDEEIQIHNSTLFSCFSKALFSGLKTFTHCLLPEYDIHH